MAGKIVPFFALVILSVSTQSQNSTDLFFSEYMEGTGNNQAIEIFNPGSNSVDLINYILVRSNDGGGWEIWRSFPVGISLPSKTVWTIVNDQFTAPVYDISLANERDISPFIAFRGNDAIGLMKLSGTDTILVDVIGIPDENPGSGWDVAGVYSATSNHTLIRKPEITTGNTNWDISRGSNTSNSEWILKVYDFADSLGHHYFKPIILVNVIKLTVPFSNTIDSDHGFLQVKAEILPDTASNLNVYWSTSEPLVASVDQNGLVQAFNNGSTWIRAVSVDGSGIADSINIIVINQSGLIPVKSVNVHGPGGEDTIRMNQETLLLIADILPVNATNKLVKWTVDNSLLADISPDGLLTARKNGKVLVTATTTDGSGIVGLKTIIIINQYSEINTLSELRAAYTADESVFKITGEIVLSHSIFNRNIKYFQDGGAGIQIDDPFGKIATTYNAGDGIKGLTGYLEESYGMLLLHPIEDPGIASSQNKNITPITVTINEFTLNFEQYESRLIKINQLTFDQAGAKFIELTNYTARVGTDITVVRTEFANVDFLGTDIPDSANVSGIAIQLNNTPKIAPRNLEDFEKLPIPINGIKTSNFTGITIYPNPANKELHIMSEDDIIYTEIRDITGRINESIRVHDSQKIIDIGNLSNGLYIITFYLENSKFNSKFIKY